MIRPIATVLLVTAAACTAAPTVPPSPAVTAAAGTPTGAPTPPGADRYGLVIGRSIRSEADPRQITELATGPVQVVVSPEGRRLAYWAGSWSTGEARVLRLLDLAAPAHDRILVTLSPSETADVSTGGGVVWSSDGTGLLIGVNSIEYDRVVPVGAGRPLYAALRGVDVASGEVREIVRLTASLPLRPVAWDRASRTAAATGIGGGGYTGSYVVAREGVAPSTTPMCCNILPAVGAPDASRALAVSFDPRALFVWPLADPLRRTTMDAAAGERIGMAVWRNEREIVVRTDGDAPAAQRLEVWSLDGTRRVVLHGAGHLAGVRRDGSAAIVNGHVVDLDTGARWPIPGLTGSEHHLATLLLR